MNEPERAGVRQRLFVIALFGIFMFPILGAMVLNVVAPSWLPFGQVNRGQLLDPPPQMDAQLRERTGRHAPTDPGPTAPWMVVHVGPPVCGDVCRAALASQRQARLALGKDASRVERWWLMTSDPDERTVQWIRDTFPGLRWLTLTGHWPVTRSPAPLQVVDPAGFVILSYESASAASDMLKDLKRLLKISKQG